MSESDRLPFEELKDILKSFNGNMITTNFKREVHTTLDVFKHKMKERFQINNNEIDNFVLSLSIPNEGGTAKLKCDNLFTACILFGRYVPYYIVDGKDNFQFKDGVIIAYSHEYEEFMCNKLKVDISGNNKTQPMITTSMTTKEFNKKVKTELKYINKWEKDIKALLKLQDSDFKYKQLNNAVSAIYTGYNSLRLIIDNHKPNN